MPIIVTPDWTYSFKIICDASRVALDVILGQCRDKIFYSIYYSKSPYYVIEKLLN